MFEIKTLDVLQWAGCITGIMGALLLALNTKISGWGFVLFLISNGFWIMYGIETKALGLITTQVVFTLTSLTGIYRWLVVGKRKKVVL
ncbi:MAG: hypothetical protein I8H71_04470 [Xanthomonadaceae bacterium]|nr:hypothetical protein [Xanthomonadaceae bacterium]